MQTLFFDNVGKSQLLNRIKINVLIDLHKVTI